jgi:hypothetical protein
MLSTAARREFDEDNDELPVISEVKLLAQRKGLADDLRTPCSRIVELDRPSLAERLVLELEIQLGDVACTLGRVELPETIRRRGKWADEWGPVNTVALSAPQFWHL